MFFLHLHPDLCPRSWRNYPLCWCIYSALFVVLLGRQLETPRGCCELLFPSLSWRTDDGGPALFAAPAPPLLLLLLLPVGPGRHMSSASKASSADGLQGAAAAPKLWLASLLQHHAIFSDSPTTAAPPLQGYCGMRVSLLQVLIGLILLAQVLSKSIMSSSSLNE